MDAPFLFDQVPATADLADVVASVWVARGRIGYGRERILPSPAAVLIVNLGSPIRVRASASPDDDGPFRTGWLVGPQTRYIENEPLAETDVVGATLRPWGPAALFDLEGSQLRDRIVPLEAVWGPGLEALRDAMASASSARARQSLLVRALSRRRRAGPPGVVDHAATRLASTAPVTVGAVAAELRISRKHLDALFGRYIGLPPRAFGRVHRFDRTLQALGAASPPSLSSLAHEHGYYDQAHMNRDFAHFGSVTPTEYLRLRARHMTAEDDPSGLFVPGL